MKNFFLILFSALLFILISSENSYARQGFWLGFEGNYGLTSIDFSDSSSQYIKKNENNSFGVNFAAEYNFMETVGVAFGAGYRFWNFSLTSTSNSAKIRQFDFFVPLTARIRPIPWLFKDSDFTLYLGAGFDFSYGSVVLIRNSSGTEDTGTGDFRVGFILESGLGYYIAPNTLIQGGIRYNLGLNNINSTSISSFSYKPTFTEFTLGMRFRIGR